MLNIKSKKQKGITLIAFAISTKCLQHQNRPPKWLGSKERRKISNADWSKNFYEFSSIILKKWKNSNDFVKKYL